MSYPGRPPIVPGIPIPPAIGIPRYMPPIMPPVMTMPPVSINLKCLLSECFISCF